MFIHLLTAGFVNVVLQQVTLEPLNSSTICFENIRLGIGMMTALVGLMNPICRDVKMFKKSHLISTKLQVQEFHIKTVL